MNDLWLRDAVFTGRINIEKVAGELNTADRGTKPLTSEGITIMMQLMDFTF